jgi:hypothetical protein
MGKGKSRAKGGKQKKASARSASSSMTAQEIVKYTGPIRPFGTANADHIEVVRLVYIAAVGTNASGILSASFSNNPSSAADFSAYANLYTQYRILAMRLHWIPNAVGFQSGSGTNVQGPLIQFVVRSTSAYASPANQAAAYDNDGAVVRNVGKEFAVTVKLDGTPDADWKGTQAPSVTWYISLYTDSFTPSVTYGSAYIDYLAQFRARI